MMHGDGMGFNWKGLYDTALMARHARWREQADRLSPTLKLSMFVGEFYLRQYGGRFYAKAQNRRASCGWPTTRSWSASTCC